MSGDWEEEGKMKSTKGTDLHPLRPNPISGSLIHHTPFLVNQASLSVACFAVRRRGSSNYHHLRRINHTHVTTLTLKNCMCQVFPSQYYPLASQSDCWIIFDAYIISKLSKHHNIYVPHKGTQFCKWFRISIYPLDPYLRSPFHPTQFICMHRDLTIV